MANVHSSGDATELKYPNINFRVVEEEIPSIDELKYIMSEDHGFQLRIYNEYNGYGAFYSASKHQQFSILSLNGGNGSRYKEMVNKTMKEEYSVTSVGDHLVVSGGSLMSSRRWKPDWNGKPKPYKIISNESRWEIEVFDGFSLYFQNKSEAQGFLRKIEFASKERVRRIQEESLVSTKEISVGDGNNKIWPFSREDTVLYTLLFTLILVVAAPSGYYITSFFFG